MSLTALAVRNYRFVSVITAALLVVGVLGFLGMPRQEDPTLPAYVGVATIIMPGASVDEIEDRVLDPLEEAVHELEEVEEIRGTALDGAAVVRAEFREDVDTDEAYDLFVQRVTAARTELPEGVSEIHMRAEKPSNVIVFQVAIHAPDAEPAELETWAEELESRLRSLPDAKAVEVEGVQSREIHVAIDPSRLATMGLTAARVAEAVAAAGAEIPGGIVNARDRRFSVRPVPRFGDVEDVGQTVLTVVNGRPVRLEHVADVTWGYEDPHHLVEHKGEPATLVSVSLKEGRNVFDLSAGVDTILERFRGDLPPSLTATVVIDQSESVERNIETFLGSLLQGGAIIVVLVTIVIGWRPAFVVTSALLLTIGISFGLLRWFGIALQQISIAGLVTVLGLLVDNAIVVVEGIMQARHRGLDAIKAAITGTDRVGSAVASSTATTVAAFVPMMLTAGSVGDFTRDIPIVVATVLVVSLGVALLVSPLVAAGLLRGRRAGRPGGLTPWVERHVVGRWYPRVLSVTALRRPWLVVAVAAVGVGLSLGASRWVGMNFFPSAEKNVFLVRVETPTGTRIGATGDRAREVASWIGAHASVTGVTMNVGKGSAKIYYNQIRLAERSNLAELVVTLDPSVAGSVPDFARAIRTAFAHHPDVVVQAAPFVQGPPVGLPVSIELTGPDLASLSGHAAALEQALRGIPGAVNVTNDLRSGAPRLDLRVDPVKAARIGLNPATVASEVRYGLAGVRAAVLRIGDEDHDVVVRVAPEGQESFADLERLRLPVPGRSPVPLAELTEPVLSPTYAAIHHTDLKRSVIVGSDVDGRLAADVLSDLMPAVTTLPLGPEEAWSVIGEDEERDRAFLSMLTNVVVAIGLIYGILVLQFRSYAQPLVVFSSLPVALAGSVFGLLIGGWPFGFTAFIGLLALTGIVVNDAIVLVDQVNRERRSGRGFREAVQVGTASRVQPVLLTTATTVCGLLPLTLSGHSMWGPMGWVIIGGLTAATAVTLGLVPALYVLVERRGAVEVTQSSEVEIGLEPLRHPI